jgi:hypothetical protein
MEERLPGQLEPARPWDAMVQLVGERPRGRVDDVVEVAVVMRVPGGRFLHRRVVGRPKDLAAGMPGVLFDPVPDPALLRARARSRVRTVHDRAFDTLDDALESAVAADPPADPDAWVDQEAFRWEVVDDGSGAEDHDLEVLGVLIGIMTGWVVAASWMLGAFWLDDHLGLSTPAGRNSWVDNVFGFVAIVGGFGFTWWMCVAVPAFLARLVLPISLRAQPPTVRQYPPAAPDSDDTPGTLPVPTRVSVTARTANVLVAGWLTCGAVWAVAGVVTWGVEGPGGLTAFFLGTGSVLGVVGVLASRRRLVADPAGVTIVNYARRVRVPWGELRSVEFRPLNDVPVAAAARDVPVDAVATDAGQHRLRFNGRVTAEVPVGPRRPGEYLFDLRETLLSMQRTHSAADIQDSLPVPTDERHRDDRP